MTVVTNEDNELIPTRLVTGWRVCIDYRKLNDATRKDHLMLEHLAGNEYYYFLDGFSRYFSELLLNQQGPRKDHLLCTYGTFDYRHMLSAYVMIPGTFKRYYVGYFHGHDEETMEVLLECIEAFEILKKKLNASLILVAPDWDLPFEIMGDASDFAVGAIHPWDQDAKSRLPWWILLLQEFDVIIRDKKGAKNLAADHLSRLENPHQGDLEKKEINETFPLETLRMISFHGDSSTPWFADIANYLAGNFVVKGMSP
ncbi:reverse transcriptase domain-containing protein [Tanacetum coccineum]